MKETDSRYKKTYPVSWSQLHNDCRALAWRLLEKRSDWERIIAIARGGLVPAAIIARELDIPLGTVRSRIFRGRKRLRESLAEYARQNRMI